MSFFDLIENDQIQPPDPETTTWNSRENMPDPGSDKPNRKRKTGQRIQHPRPEKLNFLKPCPICKGVTFTHRDQGGFFCNNCQPGIEGRPVIATGNNKQPPETVEGLPCAGCGSTIYTKIKNGFIFDDGTLADGYHCSGVNCHIKLLIGNKAADRRTKQQALGDAQPRQEVTRAARTEAEN